MSNENITYSNLFEGLEPVESITFKSVINRLNYSQVEVLVRIAQDEALPTDLELAKGFAAAIFGPQDVMHPFFKGLFQERGTLVLQSKPRA